jgi:hypothetical protein
VKQKLLRLFRLFIEADSGKPDIGRTQVSRDSDRLIDSMALALVPYVTAYMAQGHLSPLELQKLDTLFLTHAQDQYFLGHSYADKKKGDNTPVSQLDLMNMQTLASRAKNDFITSLSKQKAKTHTNQTALTAGAIAGLAAATLGIVALNQGTIDHAEKVQFVTRRDFRVCPICEAFDGKVYGVENGMVKNGPRIPMDTHPNCRCRYIVLTTQYDER